MPTILAIFSAIRPRFRDDLRQVSQLTGWLASTR